MAEFARSLISAYQAGTEDRQAGQRRSAISAYLPGALEGNKNDVAKLGTHDPDLAVRMMANLQAMDEQSRQRAIQESEWLGPLLIGQDGKPLSDPSAYGRLQSLAALRGMPKDKVALITPENATMLIAGSEAARNYQRQSKMDAETMRHNRASEAMAGASRGSQPPSGYTWGQDGKSLIPIPGGPADRSAGNRNLPSPMSKEFATLGDQAAQLNTSTGGFSDDYASQGVAGVGGDTALWFGRNLPVFPGGSSQEAVGWWQGYDRFKNVVRNELFGSALTPSEQAAFEKSDINSSMAAPTIRKNLQIQQRIVQGATSRRARAAKAQGYNPEAIEELTGVSLQGGGDVLRYDAQGNRVQ